ncbi:MAG: hydrophobe/amphiphile efflux-1 family RND transporter, partial [Desulfobacteraceae bacterium 4572_19]
QAAPSFRSNIEDIKRLEVKNNKCEMVPLGTLVSIHEVFGPQIITRYNMYPAATVNGSSAPGYSSGDALITMEQIANANLPSTMGFDWTGMSFQEKAAGSAVIIFVLAGIFVYLVLCAQYESWTISAGVILVIPLALLGTVAAVFARSMDNNIYTQIGIVLLIALACKNAILIIEFAVDARKDGKGILDAAIEAARTRFRPVLMTSFAFILGVFPLAIASGSGAAGRQALGTAVCGGMLAATVLGVLFIPVFYVLIESFNEWVKPKNRKENG